MARELKAKVELDVKGAQDLAALNKELEELRTELAALKSQGIKTAFDGLKAPLDSLNTNLRGLPNSMKSFATGSKDAFKAAKTSADDATKSYKNTKSVIEQTGKVLQAIARQSKNATINIHEMEESVRVARKVLRELDPLVGNGGISNRQANRLTNLIGRFSAGDINFADFQRLGRQASKAFSDAYNKALEENRGYTANQARRVITEQNVTTLEQNRAAAAQKTADAHAKNEETLRRQIALNNEAIAQQESISERTRKATEERGKQEEANTRRALENEERAATLKQQAADKYRDYQQQAAAAELARQQKLAKNEQARLVLQEQLRAMAEGTYNIDEKAVQKLLRSTARLKDTLRTITNFAATGGFKGTAGAEATSILRAQNFYSDIYAQAIDWKRVNSEEGKAADTLGRMIVDVKSLQSGINRVHTAFGQMASTLSAVRQIGVEFRKTITAIVQPIANIVSRLSSAAFRSSLDALKQMELSQIGFGNFYGQSAVSGIMTNIKQEALLSPMSAAQLSSYVSQIAPLSKGNSQLAIDATMGVAKMIQYSGGEVATEMEYVIKNLRDVIAKGKALAIDIRQFNRAMPALTKVLADMGESDLIKNGELVIDEAHAPKLLEAFQKVNEYGDVSTIFEKTSETISGLMERVEEQVQFLLIDVGEFSGLTKLIKDTISDFLNDSDGLLEHIKTQAQFIGRDVTNWLKTRDWERVLNIAKEVASTLWNGLKESLGVLKSALGGSDWESTLKNLAQLISNFIKGIAQSYSWLLGIMNGLNKSGILGSGLVQGGMGVLGFLSGNAGTLLTGALRAFGNFQGTVNQATFSLIHAMEAQQAELIKSATTISTFDEALLIASKSIAGFAETLLQIDTAAGGVLTAEQREIVQKELNNQATQRETLERQAHTIAAKADTAAAEMETAARNANTASLSGNTTAAKTGLLGPAATGAGTKIGSILSTAAKGLLAGVLVGSISSSLTETISNAAGNDKYGSANAGNWVGSVGGFAAGGAMIGSAIPGIGTLAGAIVGGLAGVLKALLEQNGILDQARIDELEEFKETVNNGTYVKQLLSTVEGGNNLTTEQINSLNSQLVKQMNQWSQSWPNGSATMLKEYLNRITINGHDIETEVKKINDDIRENANLLWKYVEADDVEKGNDFANTLSGMGYSSYEIAAMIYGKAAEAGKDPNAIRDYLLKWGSTNDAAGNDYTWKDIAVMSEEDKLAVQKKLQTAWFEIGKEGAANMAGDNAQKEEFAYEFADVMSKFLVGAVDKIDEEKLLSLVDWADYANTAGAGGVKSIFSSLGLGLSSEGALGVFNGKSDEDFKSLIEKYGLTSDNIELLGNSITETVADHDDINKTIETMTAGQKKQEIEAFEILNYMKYEKSTSDYLKDSIYPKLLDIEKAAKEGAGTTVEIQPSNNEFLNDASEQSQARANAVMDWMRSLNPKNRYNGGILYRAAGGGARGVDTIPAMLQQGEFVVRKSTVDKIGLGALNALNTGNMGYFARVMGRQNIYGDYNGARTWNTTSNDNRKSIRNFVKIVNKTQGARLNSYYGLANRLAR